MIVSRHLHTRTCSGESDVRGQAEKQRDTNSDSTFDRARCEENKIHSAVLAGFAYENLTRAPCQRKSPVGSFRRGFSGSAGRSRGAGGNNKALAAVPGLCPLRDATDGEKGKATELAQSEPRRLMRS